MNPIEVKNKDEMVHSIMDGKDTLFSSSALGPKKSADRRASRS